MKDTNDGVVKSDGGIFKSYKGHYTFVKDFDNGIVKCENGQYYHNRGGLWFRCDESYAKKIMLAEMGYQPRKSQQVPGRAKQFGE